MRDQQAHHTASPVGAFFYSKTFFKQQHGRHFPSSFINTATKATALDGDWTNEN